MSMTASSVDDDSQGLKDLYCDEHEIPDSALVEFQITYPIDQVGEHGVYITVLARKGATPCTIGCETSLTVRKGTANGGDVNGGS